MTLERKVTKFGGGKKVKAPMFKKGIKDEIVVRICQPNHKEGPFDAPTRKLINKILITQNKIFHQNIHHPQLY